VLVTTNIVSILFGRLLLLLLRIPSRRRRRRRVLSYGLNPKPHTHHEGWMIICQETLFF
jgi:hypothetical protein